MGNSQTLSADVAHPRDEEAMPRSMRSSRCAAGALSIGQERGGGRCAAVEKTDYAMSGHRPMHIPGQGRIIAGDDAEIYGKATGCCGGNGGSMLWWTSSGFWARCPSWAAQYPSRRTAFASQLRGDIAGDMSFFGEAQPRGVFMRASILLVEETAGGIVLREQFVLGLYPMSVGNRPHRKVFSTGVGHGG